MRACGVSRQHLGEPRLGLLLARSAAAEGRRRLGEADAAGAVRWSAQMAGEAPIYLDEEKREWDYDRQITWEEQLKVWKKGSKHKVPSIARVISEEWGKDLW